MPHEQVWTIEDLAGVTVWAPPGHWQVPPRELLRRAPSIARAFGRGLPRVLRATTMVEKQHPGDPHYYLPYIGVAPARQGNGLGTALLRPVLDRCDTEGAPAYLEATNKRNLPLYRRQGFEMREELDLPNGPRLWTMWREPAADSGPAGGDGGWEVSQAPMARRWRRGRRGPAPSPPDCGWTASSFSSGPAPLDRSSGCRGATVAGPRGFKRCVADPCAGKRPRQEEAGGQHAAVGR